MTEFITNRSLYHAKTGNFTGFCVSMPLNLDEDHLYGLFVNIRNSLSVVKEEHETWFTFGEFKEYRNNPEDVLLNLNEVADITTRLKLRRAAKRTSRRRSRKRFMRRKIRKNKDQLKKRAYSQIKTLLRKRLSGGRPWSKISLSTRARIDASINRRKSILVRMVKNRIPKMPAQETKRLQRVRLNSSYEPSSDNFIIETKVGPSAKGSKAVSRETKQRNTEGAKNRQRKHRAKIDNDITEFIKTVVISQINGKDELIEKESVGSGQINTRQLTSIGDALALCRNSTSETFRQTITSKKLCGKLKGARRQTQSKGNSSMGSTNQSNNQNDQPDLSIQPQIPYEDQPGDLNNLPDMFKNGFKVNQEYAPESLESGVVIASRMNRSNNTQIGEDLQDLQALLENMDSATNEHVGMVNDIYDRLMDSELSKEDIKFLASNKDLYTAAIGQFDSAFKEQDATDNIAYKHLSKFGFSDDTIEDYGLVSMGRGSVGVINQELDGTSKSDLVAVHLPTLLSFLGKGATILSEKEINDLTVSHIDNMNLATGGSIKGTDKEKARKIKSAIAYDKKFQEWVNSDESDEAYQLREYRKNNTGGFAYGGYIGVSMKEGDNRIASSNVSGDGLNTLNLAYRNALDGLSEKEANSDEVLELKKSFNSLLDTIKIGKISATTITSTGQSALDNAQSSITLVESTKQKLISLIENMTSGDNLQKNKFYRKFTEELLRVSLTGDGRITSNSPGIANHLFSAYSKTSTGASILLIDDRLIKTLVDEIVSGNIKINFTLKSGSIKSKSEKEYEKRFDDHITEIQKILRSGKNVGELTPKDQDDRETISSDVVSKIFSIYDRLDDLGGNKDELIKQYTKEGASSEDISSELYLILNDIRDKRYNIRIVLNILNTIENLAGKVSQHGLQTQSFSFNPILSFLVEHYSDLKEENEVKQQPEQTEDSLKSQLIEYIDNAKRWIGNGSNMLERLMQFFEIDFGVFTDYVDFQNIFPKTNTYGNTNSVFINKKEIKIPIAEFSMSDHYKKMGAAFLIEAKKKRNYTKDTEYESSPKQRHNRVKRVLARRFMEKKGLVRKGDGKDVDHKDGNPINNAASNLRVMSKHDNRAKH